MMADALLRSLGISAHPGAGEGAPAAAISGASAWRLLLISACGIAAAGVLASGADNGAAADPDLSALLRGMAIIKAAIVAAGAGIVWWRLGASISSTFALAYIGCVTAASAGAAMVWTMSHMGVATLLFHGALIAFLVIGLRDGFTKKYGKA
jgi:hypothetical protein